MSAVLLDTHALLWWLADDAALSRGARDVIADRTRDVVVSAASIWKIAIKRSLGKLVVPDALPDAIADAGLSWLAVDSGHAWRVRDLPPLHRDPSDRLLVAPALVERMPIVTADTRLGEYGVQVCW